MTASQDDLLELLYQAYNSPTGIVIRTSDPVRAKQLFYSARRTDPDLACLSFLTSPLNPNTEIIILRKQDEQDGS